MKEQGGSRSEMVFGLSKSEMSALFYRSVEVFMASRDQSSFDAVYQVGRDNFLQCAAGPRGSEDQGGRA